MRVRVRVETSRMRFERRWIVPVTYLPSLKTTWSQAAIAFAIAAVLTCFPSPFAPNSVTSHVRPDGRRLQEQRQNVLHAA